MKTAELTGVYLDYWVAEAEGMLRTIKTDFLAEKLGDYSPSTKWMHGGPIILRECIAVQSGGGGKDNTKEVCWYAVHDGVFDYGSIDAEGPTPLIAAMRAYVASKFGEEVEDI